ncbi:hypothetical protein GCM10010869_00900 [Mesorhizobium tianshanense]|uniref:Uncharacterized protein n=1 Tax=Mesorhizobium tianshanense TaxID=39844 RepID=A0A562NPF7_9HYPH|nr:hypothetical protein [Mesorhizobium tianshanense]TWI34074.1 hypothetical protein IQ26_03832 [Mesorhizobium tianshanense]GLS34502.1 hypothetical protein GCM10010869_00900 [Mesorhizobium tianshanense]
MTDQAEKLFIVPVTALVATLLAAEREKGAPLTEGEVLQIRDQAPSIAMPAHAYRAVIKVWGYDDIDPENVWGEWQLARKSLEAEN